MRMLTTSTYIRKSQMLSTSTYIQMLYIQMSDIRHLHIYSPPPHIFAKSDAHHLHVHVEVASISPTHVYTHILTRKHKSRRLQQKLKFLTSQLDNYFTHGMATCSRLLRSIRLFCRILSLLQDSFAKETYNFKEPTRRSHPIAISCSKLSSELTFVNVYRWRWRASLLQILATPREFSSGINFSKASPIVF